MSSTGWTAIGGAAVVAGTLAGAALWRHTHPNAPLPFADLPNAVQNILPGPPPQAPASAPPAPAAPNPQIADRGPAPPTAENPAAAPPEAPSFDVVRVEKSGDAVIAGKGAPGADVALMASGKKVAEAKADANGQFVMTPPPLAPGSYDLKLQQQAAGQPPQESKQSVAVAVPNNGTGAPVAALSEPGQPTKVFTAPAQSAKPGADVALAIRSAELENGTGFFVSGTAPAGAKLRLYLNDSHIADVTAGPNGQWTLRVRNGLTGGHYTVRADSLGSDDRKVVARVEVPFDVPMAMAKSEPAKKMPPAPNASVEAPVPPSAPNPAEVASAAPTPAASAAPAAPAAPATPAAAGPPAPAPKPPELAQAAPAPQRSAAPSADASTPATPDVAARSVTTPDAVPGTSVSAAPAATANVVVANVETALVVQGDNLWDISRQRLGDPLRYTRIYTANVGQIRNPNLIYPGQVFVVPHD